MTLDEFLKTMVEIKASDVFIIAGLPLTYEQGGKQVRTNEAPLMPADTEAIVKSIYEASIAASSPSPTPTTTTTTSPSPCPAWGASA